MSINTQLKRSFSFKKLTPKLKVVNIDDDELDDINFLALQSFNSAVAGMYFNDEDKWILKFNAQYNFDEKAIQNFFKKYATNYNELTIIEDVSTDHRFNSAADGNFRFFISKRLTDKNQQNIGFLFVVGFQTQKITSQQVIGLNILARQTIKYVENKRAISSTFPLNQSNKFDLLKNAVDAVVITTVKGIIQEWNTVAEQLFEINAEDVIGKSVEIILQQEDRNHFSKAKFIENEKHAYIFKNKSGKSIHTEIGRSSQHIGGQLYHIYFIQNTTAQIEAVNALTDKKNFFENILNQLPVDIAVFDTQHKYVFVNPVAIRNEKLRAYIIGKDDFEYAEYMGRDSSVAELRRAQFNNIISTKKEIRWEENRKADDGFELTHLRRLLPVYNDAEEITMVLGFGIDITDRKKQSALVNQLSLQNVQLIDFCNIVSHNLRSPLVNLSMLVNYIKATDNYDEQRILIDKMTPVLDNLHETFNELVESIQIKHDLEIQSEHIDLRDAISRTMQALDMEIMDTGAEIQVDFSEAPYINYPSKYINSIFLNVLSNALKYRSLKRKPEIRLKTQLIEQKILFTISDNGQGVNLDRHKNNFFKIGKVFHRHPNAKGFGLFMTRTQVEAMGGKIWLESTPDVGTTFFIEFENQNT